MSLRYYHFSVDDVLDSLLEVSDRGQPLFEHPFFAFLQQLHKYFDASVDLYLFLKQPPTTGHRTLAEVTCGFSPNFQTCPWMRLGPHALDYATPPYAQSPDELRAVCQSIFDQIDRIAGKDRTSSWVRLHYFSECFELAEYFKCQNIEALLTTDKPAISYRLPNAESDRLRIEGTVEFSGMRFVRSNVRVENLVDRPYTDEQLDEELQRLCAGGNCAVVFTHEYELVRTEVREMTFRVFSWLRRRQLVPLPFANRGLSFVLE